MRQTPRSMKVLIRVGVALFGALFGSLAASVSTCTFAATRSSWPHWADYVCGHNVWAFWLLTAPPLFALFAVLLGSQLRRFRRRMVVILLAVYGLYGLAHLVGINAWWVAVFPVVTLVAAAGVALGKRWARYLVYVLSLVWVAQWSYYVWLAVNSGYFRSSGVELSILSLLPGAAFLLLVTFCCYVVTVLQPTAEIGRSM
jgi:hypothetical protein